MGRLSTVVAQTLSAGALFVVALSAVAQQAEPTGTQARPESIELTNKQTTGSFAVSPDVLASAPPVLGLSFPRIVNPANTPFSIFVHFSYRTAKATGTSPEKMLVGNASLYPADRPGGFRLRASAAFAKLKAAKATDIRLVVEMKRIHPAQPWTPVEVTVAPPQWRGER
jgi:hypothetical protein